MQKRIIYFLLSFFLSIAFPEVQAQILDDSTKNVYGPETTRYFYESSIVQERDTLFTLDTTLVNLHHHFVTVSQYKNRLQDLGNIGTAIRPVFFQAPEIIGLTSGFNAYDYYFVPPESIKYYDSKSPYTQIKALFGGNARSMVDVDFSRNINPRWNLGADFTRITADRQIGATGSPQDRQVFSTAYDIYTHFITPDSSYRIMANVSRMKQEVNESGGIFAAEGDRVEGVVIPDSLFSYEDENVWLDDAQSSELRINYHVYHEYKLTNFTGFFHRFDMLKQEVAYNDKLNENDRTFYGVSYIDSLKTNETNIFRSVANTIGVKGDIGGLFYQLYVKRRDLNFTYKYLPSTGYETENYGGFDISYLQDNLGMVGFFGEYLLGGNYKLGARLTSRWFTGSIQRVRSDAPYIFNRYFGNHHEWNTSFEPMVTDELKGEANVAIGSFIVKPKVTISNINRYLYFNENKMPSQAGSFAQIFSPGVDFRFSFFRNMNFEASATYTAITGNAKDYFRIPEIFANASLFYTNFLFKEKLQLRTGLDSHFRTAYFANDYDPVLMQFHLQNNFELPDYYTVDFFVNFKVSSARIFLKLTNLTQLVGLTDGYFTTPFYTGQRGVVDFGFSWMFYD